jgi:23S rRNA (uracil1939-C5)-methyltransferase
MPEQLSLLIEKLVYGGEGLAHADGNTVFVPYVLPGEKVLAEVRAKKKKVVWGNLVEVSSPSLERTQPACPHFGVCGGCHYQQISYAEQVRLKKEILRETLRRIGGIQWAGEIVEHTAQPYGYRNRAQWVVRRGMPRALGYYLPESSTIIPVDVCPVLSPALAQTFLTLQDMARSGKLPGEVKEIEAFTNSTDKKIALNVAFSNFAKPPAELSSLFKEALPALESLLLLDQKTNRFELTGPGYLTHEAGGFNFRVSHLSFFQVNRFLIEDVLKTVTSGASGELALDLYAGVGFFTLPLAKSFRRVASVDANLTATRDLRVNAETAGVPVTSHNVHVEDFLRHCADRPDFIVLDPPRAGLGASGAEKLAQLGAPQIAYLSCDPATLARDLAILTQSSSSSQAKNSRGARYEIAEVHFFDLFPQTYHIEALGRLRLAS